jgi:SAM-dependent methyltransferase
VTPWCSLLPEACPRRPRRSSPRGLDLAYGTGRIGDWLRAPSGAAVDGLDITPEMLDLARRKAVHRTLGLGAVASAGLPARAYDLCVQSLVDDPLTARGCSTSIAQPTSRRSPSQPGHAERA